MRITVTDMHPNAWVPKEVNFFLDTKKDAEYLLRVFDYASRYAKTYVDEKLYLDLSDKIKYLQSLCNIRILEEL